MAVPYLPAELPRPQLDSVTQGFWDAARAHRLAFQRCKGCSTWRHPPTPVCFACRSDRWAYQGVEGTGRVYSFTWAHHPFTPVLQPHLPYNVAVIEIDGAPGVRMVSNVIDVSEAELVVGLRVAVTYEAVGDHVLPRFRRGNDVV